MTNNPGNPMGDAFTQFWGDFMSRMGASGFAPPQPQPAPDTMKQMQRMFFDAMAKYADDFMRSPAFLEQLRTTMDNAMTMKKQVDTFIAQSLKAASLPTPEDAADAAARMGSLEKRIMQRLDEIEVRIAAMEESKPAAANRPGKSTRN